MESERGNCLDGQQQYLLSVDVGSTIVKGHVYDRKANVRGTTSKKIEVIHPNQGWVEIEPDFLWTQFIGVIKESVQDAGIQMNQIAGIGISTQRATFITWNKKTGQPFHNFISWQDLRAADLVKSWNDSVSLKAIHGSCKMLYFLTRRKRFQAASLITFTTQHVSLRLSWVLQNMPEVQNAAEEGNCCFGTIDTWLLYRLTKGLVYATDYSNASTTGMFDPYQICWSAFLGSLFSIPLCIFPPVMDTSKRFGSIDASIFGVNVPILALVADQQSAMFGECCFQVGDVKLTMGTGTFIAINTGEIVHTSTTGLYPLIGWKIGSEIVFLAEGNSSDTGTAVKWAQNLNLFTDVDETAKMAKSLQDSDGVYFVPCFSGLQAPVNDPWACAAFIGLNPSTTKHHLVRAILESIAFRNKQLYDTLLSETAIPITDIRADGGVCNNVFVMQMTADLLNKTIDKPQYTNMSSLGAAFLAGLAVGFWTSKEELKKLRHSEVLFQPQMKSSSYETSMNNWSKAVQRCSNWLHKTKLYDKVSSTCWPIVYSSDYNITFMGLEKLHPFDSGKWGKVVNFLKDKNLIEDDTIVLAREASQEDLLVVHTRQYLNKLKWSCAVASITEIPPLICLPNCIIQSKVLKPLRTQTGGTIMAGKLAMERGWAINVGGGFHHCSGDSGGGFCAYADITLSIKFLFERIEGVSKATIIDLDAHQGNGHERDFLGDDRVYIMDVYNRNIYPRDHFAKRAIKRRIELDWGTEDQEYLRKVKTQMEGALNEVKPDIIVYNAGTDILEGDPLGGLSISPQGVIKRDEIVFKTAKCYQIPILMVTSGGYQKTTARIIADSILNLHNLGLIDKDLATSEAQSPKVELMIATSISDMNSLSL